MLTKSEKIYLIQCYGTGKSSMQYVLAEFNEKYPNTVLTICKAWRLVKAFLKTGSVINEIRPKKKYDEDDAATLVAVDSLIGNPKLSLRKRAGDTGISKSLICKIYKENKIFAFKPRFLQNLEEGDDARRLYFCMIMGEKLIENRFFHRNIIFSDEATFTTNGVVSSQNCRYWSDTNPNFRIVTKSQYSKRVNVWCAISYNGIIGPYFIDGRLNQHKYLNLLETFFQQYLNTLPWDERERLYFQQDGCPAHSTQIVRQWLDNNFPEKWIGRLGPIPFPPRSPDLTNCDFYLWGHLKQIVYSHDITTDVNVLKERITNAVNSIHLQAIRNSYNEFKKRVEICAANGGTWIE
jgi:hypothetical protein